MTQENIIVEEVDPAKREPYVAGPNAIDISPDGDGGILKEIIKQGVGEYTPTPGCKVFVHYEGSLLDGTIFDSSKQRDSPFEFNLGKGQVIKAWDIGVATMKKGEIAMFTCKSEYAYGKTGSPPKIPPDTTLVFEVEMLDWQAEDLSSKKDGGILRHVIKAGEGHSTPNDGSTVDIHLVCEYNEKVVEERDVTFSLGEGSEFGIPPGIERALEKFKLREKSKLELKPMYGWGKEGKPDLGIPPDASLVYTITLNNFERLKDSWALDSDGKLEQGKFFKEKGTSYFKLGKFQLALKMYKKMVDYLEYDSGFEEEGEKERKSLLTVAHLNAALCHLKLEQHYEARERCDKALELDPKSDKGLFRRGQAYLGLGEPEKALNDFQAILNIDPNNKAASNHIIICGQKLKEQKIREKKIYANMFDKFAARDREEKDWRFGWWDGQNVEVQKMVIEKDVEEEDSRTKRINEKKEFIRKMQERKQRLEEELKAKSITVADEEDSNKDDQEDKENADEQKNKESIDQKNTDAITEMKKEEEEKRKQPDVMKTLGEWGKDEREREPTDFEKENPNILMLEGSGDFKNM